MIAKTIDTAAASAIGAGCFMMATGLKEMPTSLDESLGSPFGEIWALLLLLGSAAAAAGAILRPTDRARREHLPVAPFRVQLSVGLEYGGWLAMAMCSLIYAGAAGLRFGLITGALTIGFAVGLGLLAAGRWWSIQIALTAARKADR